MQLFVRSNKIFLGSQPTWYPMRAGGNAEQIQIQSASQLIDKNMRLL